ncbi:MAG: hypothetical protein MZV70_03790 [Desulfobacterales bacterium]|nr:hypothetical protein [Desulfobacterales bacterium]
MDSSSACSPDSSRRRSATGPTCSRAASMTRTCCSAGRSARHARPARLGRGARC